MKTRTITGAVLIAAATAITLLGGWVFDVTVIAVICVALYEMTDAMVKKGHQVVRWPVWLATVLSIPAFLLYGSQMLWPIVCGCAIVIITYVLFHGEPQLDDIFVSIMPLLAVSLPGMCLLSQNHSPEAYRIPLICLSLLMPVMCDTFAYFIGSKFGKRKLIPKVSPNKTVAGAVAGWIGAEACAMGIWGAAVLITGDAAALPPMWHFAAVGFLGGYVSQIGDLFASLVKRHCGVKDYGSIFPGHGGMMDRMDSILFASVLVYIYQQLLLK